MPSETLYIAGHRGLVGSAVSTEAQKRGMSVVGRTHAELELMDTAAVDSCVAEMAPAAIVMAGGRVGGIGANSSSPADFVQENLQVQLNLLGAAVRHRVPRVLFISSSAVYPQHAPQPFAENLLLMGSLEPAHEAYAIAKIAGMLQVRAIRKQHDLPYVSVVPTNLYGPAAKFDAASGHVVPAMIRRFHEAKVREERYVTLWGTGAPRRELLHVDDFARAALLVLEKYNGDEPLNVGTGTDVSIAELARLVGEVVGFEGGIVWDRSKPDGATRRLLDSRNMNGLGWNPRVDLEQGLRDTYDWYLDSEIAAVAK